MLHIIQIRMGLNLIWWYSSENHSAYNYLYLVLHYRIYMAINIWLNSLVSKIQIFSTVQKGTHARNETGENRLRTCTSDWFYSLAPWAVDWPCLHGSEQKGRNDERPRRLRKWEMKISVGGGRAGHFGESKRVVNVSMVAWLFLSLITRLVNFWTHCGQIQILFNRRCIPWNIRSDITVWSMARWQVPKDGHQHYDLHWN